MRRWRQFRDAQAGLAAVEFALILPAMIALFFGTVEVTMALICRTDVSIMASTAADLIAQERSASTSDISNVYSAAGTILYPYPGTPTIRITSIVYDPSTQSTTSGKVAWTCMQSGNATLTPSVRNLGDTVNFTDNSGQASAIMVANGSVIMAEVAYNYSSPTHSFITPNFKMTNLWYTKPRRVQAITGPGTTC